MPQSKLVFFCLASAFCVASVFCVCFFLASHPLVAKFLGVRGYFFSLGILKFRHCERSEAISRNSRILVIAREQSDRSNLVQGLIMRLLRLFQSLAMTAILEFPSAEILGSSPRMTQGLGILEFFFSSLPSR